MEMLRKGFSLSLVLMLGLSFATVGVQAQESPFIEANITHEWIDFFEFPPDETIHVLISYSDGSSFDTDVIADSGGYSHLDLWEFDEEINPDDVIVATATGVVKDLLLVDLTLDLLNIDAGDAYLEGTAPDGLPVFVVVCNPPLDEFTEPDCVAGDAIHPQGIDWWIDFSPDFEIFPEADAWAYIFDEDGDATMAVLDDEPAPQASFIVFPEYDFVQGFGWQEGEEVTLIVDDDTEPGNGFLLLTTGISTQGDWGVSVDFNLEIDIQPGYRVIMFWGDLFKMHDVTDLSVTAINPDNDTVSGTAFPGSIVNLWVHWTPGTDIMTSADEFGNWVGPFAYDLVPGTGGIAAQFDDDDDGTFIDWWIPFDEDEDGIRVGRDARRGVGPAHRGAPGDDRRLSGLGRRRDAALGGRSGARAAAGELDHGDAAGLFRWFGA